MGFKLFNGSLNDFCFEIEIELEVKSIKGNFKPRKLLALRYLQSSPTCDSKRKKKEKQGKTPSTRDDIKTKHVTNI